MYVYICIIFYKYIILYIYIYIFIYILHKSIQYYRKLLHHANIGRDQIYIVYRVLVTGGALSIGTLIEEALPLS